MANFQAYNDRIWLLPLITTLNPTTGVTGTPTGALTITSSNPTALAVAINQGRPLLQPMVRNSPGITVAVSSPGLTSASFLVDVVDDPNAPLQLVVDTNAADATTTAQNVPTAPGP